MRGRGWRRERKGGSEEKLGDSSEEDFSLHGFNLLVAVRALKEPQWRLSGYPTLLVPRPLKNGVLWLVPSVECGFVRV